VVVDLLSLLGWVRICLLDPMDWFFFANAKTINKQQFTQLVYDMNSIVLSLEWSVYNLRFSDKFSSFMQSCQLKQSWLI
jgi:hypothetical protein